MEAGYVSENVRARSDGVVAGRPSLTVVTTPVSAAIPELDVAGGIVRFSLGSSRQGGEIDCIGSIVRFGFGSHGH